MSLVIVWLLLAQTCSGSGYLGSESSVFMEVLQHLKDVMTIGSSLMDVSQPFCSHIYTSRLKTRIFYDLLYIGHVQSIKGTHCFTCGSKLKGCGVLEGVVYSRVSVILILSYFNELLLGKEIVCHISPWTLGIQPKRMDATHKRALFPSDHITLLLLLLSAECALFFFNC